MFSLVVATSLLAIVTVPLSLHLLGHWLPTEISIDPLQVAATIFNTFLLPLAVGMLVRRFSQTLADRICDPLLRVAGAALLLGAFAIIVSSWDMLLALGLPTFLAFAGFTFASLAVGHLLGGTEHHMSLAIACATRHIGLAMLVAAKVRGPKPWRWCPPTSLFSHYFHSLYPMAPPSPSIEQPPTATIPFSSLCHSYRRSGEGDGLGDRNAAQPVAAVGATGHFTGGKQAWTS